MGQSERNNFQASVRELLSGLDGFVSTRSVVGEPIRMGEATLIPLMDIQIGVGAGSYGGKSAGSAGGLGATIKPSSMLLLQDGKVKLIRITNEETVMKVIDAIPEVIDRVKGAFMKTDKKVDEKAEEILRGEAEKATGEEKA
ncbi:MAG: sporulation protein [Lachnospiraceae bacterium]|nr:sporulation protein [Lachnospiraceae bacterium]MBQ7601892.1 sporulation protein [Lachnospiraceae bacterium]MBR5338565.1 sporulation protein [Lachnospiraceae bacterium]